MSSIQDVWGDAAPKAFPVVLATMFALLLASACTRTDATGDTDKPIFDFDLAVGRVRAGVEANSAPPTPQLYGAMANWDKE